MGKHVIIEADGSISRIEYVKEALDEEALTLAGAFSVEVDYDIPNELILLGHYWDFEDSEFKERPLPPDEFHDWATQEKKWVLNAERKAAWLSQTINPIRDQLEAGRVTVDGHLIDIDERAEKRMSDALEMWDALEVTTLPWVLGDNTTLRVDKAQLQRFYDEGRRLRALRSLQLHTEARALKDNLDTTQEDIDNWAATYMEADDA